MAELTPEERRAFEDFRSLTVEERRTLAEFAQFANRPSRADADVKNLDQLIDLVRKRPKLIALFRRAEMWEEGRRYLIMLGGLGAAITAVLVAYKTIAEGFFQ
jgi:hypothetical protein